jgi:formylglycine-generating enzyme required for sulfatase activity
MRPVLLCILLICGSATPASAQQLKAITNSIGMKLVLILPGDFKMVSPGNQQAVTISQWYYLAAHEVTQEQYEKVMGNNPSIFKGARNPVEMVSWEDAVSFCKKLSERPEEKAAGREYRLPTEAEWEYACRAASTTSYCFGDKPESLGEYAWTKQNAGDKTHPVGERMPNRWGLYDMHGNVFEWCQDWGADYLTGATTDPQGPNEGSLRVYRGGSWHSDVEICRSAYRNRSVPSNRDDRYGFRVALSPPSK